VKRAISFISLLLFVVAFMNCNSVKPQRPPDSSQGSKQLLEGEYLSTDYIEELKKTRSPLQAGKGYGVELVRVRRNGTKFLLEPIINFHDGTQDSQSMKMAR
jgi:hypothetical protein